MDTYSEQLVKKISSSSDGMKKILILAGGVILAIVLLVVTFTVTPFALLAVAVVVYGIYWFMSSINVEYEYIVTNGCVDIDKIISQRKRVNLISVDAKAFTDFGNYDGQDFDGTVISAIGGEYPRMYADFTSSQYGNTRLVFSPDEKTLECIRPYLRVRK